MQHTLAKRRTKSRQAFGLDSLIMIISAIVIIGILAGISKAFNTTLEDSYVSLTTTMPRFDSTGYGTISNSTSTLYSQYAMLRSGTAWAIGAVLITSAILFMLEQIEIIPASTAFGIISRGSLYFVILFGFPPLWDLYSAAIEAGSRAILDPAGTGQTPVSVVTVFNDINGMGISHGQVPKVDKSVLANLIQLFNGADMVSAFSDQGKAFILGFIGGLIALVASFLTYMFSAIRQVLTAVLVAGLPVILVLSLVPWFQNITRRLLDTLFGLSIVPIFSSLVMVTGAAYLGSISAHPVEEQWFASVAVLTLATFVPTILVPLLGSLFSSMTNMVSSGVGFGSMIASAAARTGQGIAGGALGAVHAVQGRAAEYSTGYSGLDMAMAAGMGGFRGGIGGLVHGASYAGSHVLKKLGAGEIGRDMQNMGLHISEKFQDAARQDGISIIQPAVDRSLTANSAGIMNRLAVRPVPQEKLAQYTQKGSEILELARNSIQSENYSNILGHPYFRSVPVQDKETFSKAVAATIVNHGLYPDKLANISYNLERIGGLNDENIKEFIRNNRVYDSSFSSETRSGET